MKFILFPFYLSILIFAVYVRTSHSYSAYTKQTGKPLQAPFPVPQSNRPFQEKINLNATIYPSLKIIKGNEIIKFSTFDNIKSKDIYLMLYPNKFLKKPLMIRDYNFHQLYPYNFNSGNIKIENLSVHRSFVRSSIRHNPTFPKFNRALYLINIRFTTLIPTAFGSFGSFKKEIVLNAPFYPSLNKNANPTIYTKFDINIKIKNGYEAIFNGNIYKRRIATVKKTNFLSIVLAPSFIKETAKYKNILTTFYTPSASAPVPAYASAQSSVFPYARPAKIQHAISPKTKNCFG